MMRCSFALVALLALCLPAHAASPCVAVIGTGQVGGTLGPRLASLGHRVIYGSRDPGSARVTKLVSDTGAQARAAAPGEAAASCRLVLFAVPWEAARASLESLGSLEGKVIIDVTNPLDVRDGQEVAFDVERSGAEQIQAWAPGASVVKAFNTLNYSVMADPSIAGGPVSVPLSSDDPKAKAEVEDIVAALGLEPIDVGPLRTARYTENMALLYVSQLVGGRQRFEFYLRPVTTAH